MWKTLLILMLLAGSALGQGIIGENPTGQEREDDGWDTLTAFEADCILLDTVGARYTALEGDVADSIYMYFFLGSGDMSVAIYEIDGSDTTRMVLTSISPAGRGYYAVDINVPLTVDKEYVMGAGNETGSLGCARRYDVDGVGRESDDLANPWTATGTSYYHYALYATVTQASGATKTTKQVLLRKVTL